MLNDDNNVYKIHYCYESVKSIIPRHHYLVTILLLGNFEKHIYKSKQTVSNVTKNYDPFSCVVMKYTILY